MTSAGGVSAASRKGASAAGRAGGGALRVAAATAAIVLAVAVPHVMTLYEPHTFLIGDCPYYAQTAISIVLDRDLDLRNQLRGGLAPHQRQVSLGARGEWYPKHPILMPLLTAPLLPLFGMTSFLIVNLLVLAALAGTLGVLGRLAAPPLAAAAGALAAVLGSFLIFYDYNYSPDLLACLLLALAVVAATRGRAATGGLLAGLAVFARTSNLFLTPILLAYVAWRSRWRGALLFLAAAALPLAAQGWLNMEMFGSPLVSPYTRILSIEGDQVVLRSHMGDFDLPLLEGLRGQLLDPDKGLLLTAPVLLLALPGWILWLRRDPAPALLCFGLGEFLLLLFSRYRWWPTSHVGNRFLIPLVALSAPAAAATIEWILARVRRPGTAG